MDPLLVTSSPSREDVSITRLDRSTARWYASMTFPAYRGLLDLEPRVIHPADGDERLVRPVALAATVDGAPAGLVLGGLSEEPDVDPELLSVFVASGWRRRGVGRALLESFQETLRQQGFDRVTGVYMSSTPKVDVLEAFLAELGWQPPTVRMMVVKFTVEEAKTVGWYGTYSMRDGLEIFPWADVTDEEIEKLRASQAESPWIPDDLVPWRHDPSRLETASSIGARLDGEIVGWVVNHRIADDLVRFTSAFIREDLARKGRLVPMYSEAIRRLDDTPYRRCMFTTPAHHRGMVAFVKRRCERWVSFVGETRGTWIDLRASTRPSKGPS